MKRLAMMRHSAWSVSPFLIAEAVADEPAHRGAVPTYGSRRRHLLIGFVLVVERWPRSENHPGFAQDRYVLNRLVVDLPEPKRSSLVA